MKERGSLSRLPLALAMSDIVGEGCLVFPATLRSANCGQTEGPWGYCMSRVVGVEERQRKEITARKFVPGRYCIHWGMDLLETSLWAC